MTSSNIAAVVPLGDNIFPFFDLINSMIIWLKWQVSLMWQVIQLASKNSGNNSKGLQAIVEQYDHVHVESTVRGSTVV